METIHLKDPNRDAIVGAINGFKAARAHDCTNAAINRLWNNHFEELSKRYSTTTPYIYAFTYCEQESMGIVIKGYMDDVEQHILNKYGNAIVQLLIHKGGLIRIPKENKIWRGYGKVLVSMPQPAKSKRLVQQAFTV